MSNIDRATDACWKSAKYSLICWKFFLNMLKYVYDRSNHLQLFYWFAVSILLLSQFTEVKIVKDLGFLVAGRALISLRNVSGRILLFCWQNFAGCFVCVVTTTHYFVRYLRIFRTDEDIHNIDLILFLWSNFCSLFSIQSICNLRNRRLAKETYFNEIK